MKSDPRGRRALSPEEVAFAKRLEIWRDEHVLALNKPPGLSSQGGRIAAATLDDLLCVFAKRSGVRPRLIHRLDRDTSGVILAARSQPAAAFLGRALMRRQLRKIYIALVAPGAPEPRQGLINSPLRRIDQGRESYVRVATGDEAEAKLAATRYRTLCAGETAALVELQPLTGRMHQLRVHMAAIGRPIVGDARYGGALALAGDSASRLMLHALEITFPNPAGGETTVEASVPADMVALLERLHMAGPLRETAMHGRANG